MKHNFSQLPQLMKKVMMMSLLLTITNISTNATANDKKLAQENTKSFVISGDQDGVNNQKLVINQAQYIPKKDNDEFSWHSQFHLIINNRPLWKKVTLGGCENSNSENKSIVSLSLNVTKENGTFLYYSKEFYSTRANEQCRNYRAYILAADSDNPVTLILSPSGFDISEN